MNAPLPPVMSDPLWLEPLLQHARRTSPAAHLAVIFGQDKWPHLDLWLPDDASLTEMRQDIAKISIDKVHKNYWTASLYAQKFHPLNGYFQSDISIQHLSYKYDDALFADRPYAHGFYETVTPATRGLIYLPFKQMSYATYLQKSWEVAPSVCGAEAQKDIMPAIAWHELGHYLHSTQPANTVSCHRLDEIIADRTLTLGSALLDTDIAAPHQAWRRLQMLKSDLSGNARIYWSWQSIASDGPVHEDFIAHTNELQAVWELKARAAHAVVGTPFERLSASLSDLGHGTGLADFYNNLSTPNKHSLLRALPRLVAADQFTLPETRTLATETLEAALRFMPKLVAAA